MIPDKLRPMVAPVTAFASGLLAAYLAKHGIDVSDETAASIVVGVTAIGSHLIAIKTNPNNAAAPSMVKMAPNAPYAGATDDPFAPGEFVPPPIAPIPIGEQVSPYAPKNPIIAANAEKVREINAAAKPVPWSAPQPRPPIQPTEPPSATENPCPFCTGADGAHHPWCRAVGGDGRAPAGFFDNTQRINTAWARKLAERVAPIVAPVVAPVAEVPVEKSKILKPKATPAPSPTKARGRKKPADVVKLRRATDAAPNAGSGDPSRGFSDYVPTAKDLPRNISPRPKLSRSDKGVV